MWNEVSFQRSQHFKTLTKYERLNFQTWQQKDLYSPKQVVLNFQIPASQQMIQFKDEFGGKEAHKSSLTGANFGYDSGCLYAVKTA